MFNQFEDDPQSELPPEEEEAPPRPAPRELKVSINVASKEEPVEWMDEPSPRRKPQPKPKKKESVAVDPVKEQLGQQLQASKSKLKRGLGNVIKNRIKDIQYGVFVSQTTGSNQEYLTALYDSASPNHYVKQQIHDTIYSAEHSIQEEIKSKEFTVNRKSVPRNKEQLRELQQADKYRLLKIKEGQVKSKVGSLRDQMEREYFRNKLKSKMQVDEMVGNSDYFSMEHPRTKEAESFVKEVQSRRKEEHRRYQMYLTNKKEEQEMVRREAAEQKELQKMERRTRLKEYYQSKLMKRIQEKEEELQKREQFQEWIKEYQRQRPLEQEKQEQYKMKVVIPMLQQRHKKLMTIRAHHRPIDGEEIAQHQMKYLQFKHDDRLRKQAEMEIKEEEDRQLQQEQDQRFYKGKYRYMVLEQIVEEKFPVDGREIQQSKKDRIKAYNQHLKQYHQQTMHAKRGVEAETIANQKFMRRVRKMNGSMSITNRGATTLSPKSHSVHERSPEGDAKKQGIKNLAYIKSVVREQAAREEANPPRIRIVEERQVEKPKGYLEQQRQKHRQLQREGENRTKKTAVKAVSKDIRQTAPAANDDVEFLRAKAAMLDERLKRGEKKMKVVHGTKREEGKEVEEEYISAIKAKMHMLDHYD